MLVAYCVICEFSCKVLCCLCCFFFFQAEDGIRDAQESRGLGDVYKRQPDFIFRRIIDETILVPVHRNLAEMDCIYTLNELGAALWEKLAAVSYTHLTLPTIYSV